MKSDKPEGAGWPLKATDSPEGAGWPLKATDLVKLLREIKAPGDFRGYYLTTHTRRGDVRTIDDRALPLSSVWARTHPSANRLGKHMPPAQRDTLITLIRPVYARHVCLAARCVSYLCRAAFYKAERDTLCDIYDWLIHAHIMQETVPPMPYTQDHNRFDNEPPIGVDDPQYKSTALAVRRIDGIKHLTMAMGCLAIALDVLGSATTGENRDILIHKLKILRGFRGLLDVERDWSGGITHAVD